MKEVFSSDAFDFFKPDFSELSIPFVGGVSAGFASPADDFIHERIDLNKLLIRHPEATFIARARGNSMNSDFSEGDLLIVDKAEEWSHNRMALCYINGDFTTKRIQIEKDRLLLIPSNPAFPVLEATETDHPMIWGIIIYIIRKV